MKLTHTCIITENIDEVSEFYENILKIKAVRYGDHYTEFVTGGGTLSLFSLSEHEKLAPSTAEAASNKSIELEFEVINIHKEHDHLVKLGIEIVKPITTQPWGNRSFYFRDPDGNLINFFTKTTKA